MCKFFNIYVESLHELCVKLQNMYWHFWGVAQGLVGGGLQAWEAGQPADWEGGGGDCETAAAKSGHSVASFPQAVIDADVDNNY